MVKCVVSDYGAMLEVKLEGEADVANALALQEQLAGLLVPGRDVTVDLDAVERLDGAGLQLLFALKAFVEQAGGSFSLAATAEVPLRALETAGATKMFGLV